MKKLLTLSFILTSLFGLAKFPPGVLSLDLGINSIEEFEANLVKGKELGNSFFFFLLASNCWKTTNKELFNGTHLLYAVKLPAHAKITISVKADIDVSLYGYTMTNTEFIIPPALPMEMECQSSVKVGNEFDDAEEITFETQDVSRNLVIGVCGTKETKVGDVHIRFILRNTMVKDKKPTVYKLETIKGQKTGYKGDISLGTLMPLDWATLPSTNCFSINQINEFDGNHIYYLLDIPGNTQAKITVNSLSKKRINIFGFTGHNGVSLPPKIDKVSSCRAAYSSFGDTSKQSITLVTKQPDKVLIAVAGAKGAQSGKYHLIVEINEI
ncbi:MAG: hypothetical protein AB8B61_00605 [Cyclobacteriaceae bacterium]